jgi:hypothetical protein
VQANTLRDQARAERLEHEWCLALLQQELLEAVEKGFEGARRIGADSALGVPLDTLRQKQLVLQLQSLSASDLFNGVAVVRVSRFSLQQGLRRFRKGAIVLNLCRGDGSCLERNVSVLIEDSIGPNSP